MFVVTIIKIILVDKFKVWSTVYVIERPEGIVARYFVRDGITVFISVNLMPNEHC